MEFYQSILAISEGQQGTMETPEEFEATAKGEAAAIGKFFPSARTDANFFKSNAVFSELPNGFREARFDIYVDFLRRVSPCVIQPQAPRSWRATTSNILNIADEMGVPRSHLIIICVLSALYRHRASIGILNPRIKGDKAYNAVNDLMVMSRICQFIALDKAKSINFRFVTRDEHLLEFLKHIRPTRSEYAADSVSPGIVQFTIGYDVDSRLFPGISEDELFEIHRNFAISPAS